jgi:adenylate cyclase
MNRSERSRREWRLIVWLSIISAAISAWFGWRVAVPLGSTPLNALLQGALTSAIIATPILLIQIKGRRFTGGLRGLPLAVYFLIKALFYFAVIIGGLVLSRLLFSAGGFQLDETFRRSIIFAVLMAIGSNLVFDIGGLLGFRTLKNLLTGRYVQPRPEQRAFLLVDMKNSTGLAERLGPVRFHELLNAFFRDVSDAALECDGEIHKYVGDEAIITWPDDRAAVDSECVACPFLLHDLIQARSATYQSRFGAVPEFRASLHRGEIVAGEIGDIRREIAYVGDTLNVAARLLEAAKEVGHDVLASQDLLDRTALPAGVTAQALPVLTLRNRTAPLSIAALSKS